MDTPCYIMHISNGDCVFNSLCYRSIPYRQQVEANAIIVEKNTRCACERDVINEVLAVGNFKCRLLKQRGS
ncbi:MAG: hypothetical protein WC340_18510, partial [Kiritimatiellia bacterium]